MRARCRRRSLPDQTRELEDLEIKHTAVWSLASA